MVTEHALSQVIDALQAKCDRYEAALKSAADQIDVMIQECQMECRHDEDCDHCVLRHNTIGAALLNHDTGAKNE